MLHTRLLAFLALVMLPATAPGHNDVSKTIKTLSAKIEESPSADLYYQRATEFRALREKEHAIEDLRSALKHEPRHRPAKISLIRALGKSTEALHLAIQLQSSSAHAENSIEPTYLVAKIHHLRGNPKDALTICANLQKLSRNHSTEIDLLHAEVLLALKRPADASTILKNAWRRTNSIVLRNNWIDTALTAEQTREILPIINREISSSRFRSSWLIRRARAALIHDNKKQAHSDLQAALAELTMRIRPTRPDLSLIADRGLIHALIGNTKKAKADLALLKKSILPPSSYRLLTDTL